MPGVILRPSQLAGSGRAAHTDVKVPWLSRLAESVGRLYQLAGSGRKALLEGREFSDGPPGGPGVFGWPSRRAGSFWMALPVL